MPRLETGRSHGAEHLLHNPSARSDDEPATRTPPHPMATPRPAVLLRCRRAVRPQVCAAAAVLGLLVAAAFARSSMDAAGAPAPPPPPRGWVRTPVPSAGCTARRPSNAAQRNGTTSSEWIVAGGSNRTYRLRVPRSYDPRQPLPLILACE